MDVLQSLWDFLVGVFEQFLDLLGTAVSTIFFWLPDDPFASVWPQLEAFAAANVTAIKWLNWLVPVPAFATVFSAVLAALLIWVAYMCMTHVMDWIKTIKQTINPGG